jgi:alpha-mannosidase
MLKHPPLTRSRIRQFVRETLTRDLVVATEPLRVSISPHPHRNRREAERARFEPVAKGFAWGPVWSTVWFRVQGKVPQWEGFDVFASLELGGERTVWDKDAPAQGVDSKHRLFPVALKARGGEPVDLFIEAYGTNPNVSVHGKPTDPPEKPFVVGDVRLEAIDAEVFDLLMDCSFAERLLQSLDDRDPLAAQLMVALNDVVNLYTDRSAAPRCRKALREALNVEQPSSYHILTPVGHAHLDTAWLWPLHITRKKMAHTTATQLALMEEYPEHHFVHSQAAQYEWLENEYPALFERVKRMVKRGQWEPLGSMWVEADTNLSGGESLVRQFLYGKKYFRERFGIATKDMWLPDVFGYSAALPQILRQCGIEYFLTQKISWNQFNQFPHTTFWWEGIDGSRVFAHFPPANTYTGDASPEQLRKHLTENKDAGRCDRGLYVFGFGDGGGGPTREQIEFLRRAEWMPGMPKIRRASALQFFEDALENSRDLPVWVGELYFELHRGTYTTQALTKRMNRICEFLLRDAEALCCLSDGFPQNYPQAELEKLWKTVLLNQFHDILPGSSIKEVYDEATQQYEEVRDRLAALIRERLVAIASRMDCTVGRPVVMFHFAETQSEGSIPWKGRGAPKSLACGGEVVPVQAVDDFGERKLVFPVPEAALGAVAVGSLEARPAPNPPRLRAKPRRLESDEWSVRFDRHGNIRSIRSVEDGTEYVAGGELANVFQLFRDQPLFWDAWDVDAFALEQCEPLLKSERFEVVEEGPVRCAVIVERRFGNSRILQRISLGPTPGIRFDTVVDWHEDERMLKVAFPMNVRSSSARYEIQFGNVERPTHRNTSWDVARFEVCAQKWVDLSEGDIGVALLNDSKYGHDVLGNVLRLTLLRSPMAPDPTADRGRHRFTYVLLPHFGPYNWAGVVQAAYALNAPVHAVLVEPHDGVGTRAPLVWCEDRNIVVESVKKAEESDSIVVRMYECHNARGRAELLSGRPIARAERVNLLEEAVSEVAFTTQGVEFEYKPFEIITLRLTWAG